MDEMAADVDDPDELPVGFWSKFGDNPSQSRQQSFSYPSFSVTPSRLVPLFFAEYSSTTSWVHSFIRSVTIIMMIHVMHPLPGIVWQRSYISWNSAHNHDNTFTRTDRVLYHNPRLRVSSMDWHWTQGRLVLNNRKLNISSWDLFHLSWGC